jgi:hypothetical protein
MVFHRDLKFPDVAGVKWPMHVPGGFRADVPGPFSALPFLLSQLDSDGNEVGGIRLPEQAVPLGTYNGWAFWAEGAGDPNALTYTSGSFIPFARTRAEREQRGDSRPSVEERYGSRAEYVRRVEEAARRLVQERYLLQEDVQHITEQAGKNWDWIMSLSTSQNFR